MKRPLFTGLCTALVTPFAGEQVNYKMVEALIERQIDAGVDAIVLTGTTGESPTLTREEKLEIYRRGVETAAGRCKILAGTGSNCTANAVALSREAEQLGVDGLLVVTPYYNKATQNGLYQHFKTIADASTVPVILYNVPGRTGCNLLPKTVARLAEHERIVAIKEATGNMAQMVEIMHLCGDKIDVYSGEDALTVPMMAMGAAGTISVLSNVAPKEAVAMTDACKAGDFKTAAKMQADLLPLINALFSEVNPIPAKAGVSAMGFGEENLRLPLTPMEDATRAVLYAEMRKLGINV